MQQTSLQPPASHIDLLERPLFAAFATVAVDGSPRVNPMWFLWDADAGVLKLTHTSERYNYRYLQENPRVALSITDPDNQYRYMQLRGVVDEIEPDPTGAFYQRLQMRYRGTQSEVGDRVVRVILKIRITGIKARA